jgi:hypothetical protein
MSVLEPNVIVKSPLQEGYVYKRVAYVSASDNVIIPQQELMGGSSTLSGNAFESVPMPTYLNQDDMRFAAPRYYSPRETDVIAQAVAQRRELPEPILPLG